MIVVVVAAGSRQSFQRSDIRERTSRAAPCLQAASISAPGIYAETKAADKPHWSRSDQTTQARTTWEADQGERRQRQY